MKFSKEKNDRIKAYIDPKEYSKDPIETKFDVFTRAEFLARKEKILGKEKNDDNLIDFYRSKKETKI